MGKVLRMPGFGEGLVELELQAFTSLANMATVQMDTNIARVADFLGRSLDAMPKTEDIQIVNGEVGGNPHLAHPDGTIMRINTLRHKSLIVTTDNLVDFFRNNGSDSDLTAANEATLYLTAFIIGALAIVSQQRTSKRLNFDERIWKKCDVIEPDVIQSYRFAATVVNHTSTPIDSETVSFIDPITFHAASFMNPLTVRKAKEVAAPYFSY